MCDKREGITIIIATYNRPDCLKQAITSVIRQTYQEWLLFVIGDHCSSETETVVKSFTDARISYYNCPNRSGSQSGGNSIGIALATTPYIAFLNHDDIWLPNHLETAVRYLIKNNARCYFGRFIFAFYSLSHFPILKEAHPKKRELFRGFFTVPTYIEPVSGWVIHTDTAKNTGYWRHQDDIHRVPIQDYYLRLWRKGAKCTFGEVITGVKFDNQVNQVRGKNLYEYGAKELEFVNHLIHNDIIKLNRFIEQITEMRIVNKLQYFRKNPKMRIIDSFLQGITLNRITAILFFYTSIDLYTFMRFILGNSKGAKLRELLLLRTGEDKLPYYSVEEAVSDARQNFKKCN